MMNQVGQHVAHMIQLGFAVAVRIVEAVVDDPVLLRQRIHVHAVHHADALDQTVSVAAVLTSDQLDLVREILIDDRVVERDATFLVSRDLLTHVLPYETRRHLLVTQKPVDGIVAHIFNMVGEVRQRVVDRTHQQVLAVIQAGRAFRHALNITNLGFALGLRRFVTIRFRAHAWLFA